MDKSNRIKIISFTRCNELSLINEFDFTFVRFDLFEFADLNGFKDHHRVTDIEIKSVLKNINVKNKLIVDVPHNIVFDKNLKKIFDFFIETKADLLGFNIDFCDKSIIDYCLSKGLPLIIYSDNVKTDYDILVSQLKEFDLLNIEFFIISRRKPDEINGIVSLLNTHIVADVKTKSAGIYGKFSNLFGFSSDSNSKILNMNSLIVDGIKEYLIEK